MTHKLTGYYSIFLGAAIICMWTFMLFTESIPEGRIEMTFHLSSEFLMSLILLISGLMLLKKNKNALKLNIAGHAILIYSVLNAAGYYAERDDKIMPVFFMILFLISVIIVFFYVFKTFDYQTN